MHIDIYLYFNRDWLDNAKTPQLSSVMLINAINAGLNMHKVIFPEDAQMQAVLSYC